MILKVSKNKESRSNFDDYYEISLEDSNTEQTFEFLEFREQFFVKDEKFNDLDEEVVDSVAKATQRFILFGLKSMKEKFPYLRIFRLISTHFP